MKVKLILSGYEEIEVEGTPKEVLERADEVVLQWKVRWNGQAKG